MQQLSIDICEHSCFTSIHALHNRKFLFFLYFVSRDVGFKMEVKGQARMKRWGNQRNRSHILYYHSITSHTSYTIWGLGTYLLCIIKYIMKKVSHHHFYFNLIKFPIWHSRHSLNKINQTFHNVGTSSINFIVSLAESMPQKQDSLITPNPVVIRDW